MTRAKLKINHNFNKKIKEQIQRNVIEANRSYKEDLVDMLDDPGTHGPRTGKMYDFPFKKGHQASAPFEPPAVLTGELRDSIKEEYHLEPGIVKGFTYSDDPKSVWMELGLPDRTTAQGTPNPMAPRPAWRTVFTRNSEKYRDLLTQRLEVR